MDQYQADDTWAPEEVALEDAPGGVTAEPASATAEAVGELPSPNVLARIPELDATEPSEESPRKAGRRDGRILSQGLSTKLLLGGGLLLVLAAVFHSVFRDKEPKPGTPPAPNAPEAPVWNAEAAAESATLSAGPSYEPTMSLNQELPPAPDFISAAQAPGATPSPPPAAEEEGGSSAGGDTPQIPPDQHQSRSAIGPPRAEANRMMTISRRVPVPSGIPQERTDLRCDGGAAAQAALPTRYPACSIPYPVVQPGVARLEGIIEKPAVRTSYDATRSSVH